MYWKYFKYIMEHKKNVFIECMKIAIQHQGKIRRQLIIHAFTHDLSKFLPCEFIPYAKWFRSWAGVKWEFKKISSDAFINLMQEEKEKSYHNYLKAGFEKAWEHHYKHNKHHEDYWQGKDMPYIYLMQLIADWKGMARKFGDTAQEYYLKNYYKFNITHETRRRLEIALDLTKKYNAPICECNEEYWMTIDELIKDSEKYFKTHGEISKGTVKDNINDFLKPACDKYNLDIYTLVKNAR